MNLTWSEIPKTHFCIAWLIYNFMLNLFVYLDFYFIAGVIRTLQENGNLDHAFCTETRPYNQGARLTAYELVYEKIPATLICDSMVSMVLKDKQISAIVVGADRVVKNGDTANKIGTYQIAISAKHHNIPFYIACPITTFDPHLTSGEDIIIEERHAQEMTHVKGVEIAAPGNFVELSTPFWPTCPIF